ncbi:lysine--tRNA ligase [Patescibacteria group bacterium]|nr:lysine--tRNA ligase [Patescibacteria group bacterium]MBU1935282.1 lysine--tRNA ligase [Patescibacteria group bacterium]
MFWTDEVVEKIIETYPDQKQFIIRDEKTLSGRVHIGSLRGVVIHGIIAQVLNEKGKKARFLFEFNDYDPMDGMPKELDGKGFDKYMGMPLCNIPSPDKKAENFAEYYGEEFLGVIKEIGFDPEIPRAHDAYKSGKMNDWIKIALTKNNEIRKIYKEISGSEKEEHWSPVQVICEKCGKVGSTDVISFDGEKVKYVCKKDKVTWAEGCEHEGEISPFDGNAELTWKVEWPAKWDVYGVTIEGSGKDHNAAGGSHDIGETICKEISKTNVPFNVPYEFFLIGGKKMSSSKGIGQTARDIANLVPPEMLRFLMLSKKPNQTIEFDPEGDTIPRLFDQHDEAAKWYFHKGEKDTLQTDAGRLFQLSQITDKEPEERFLPRFSQLVFIIQIPRLDVYEEVEKMKGSKLTAIDKEEIDLRIKYAKKWLEDYAPERYQYHLQEELPESANNLTDIQKRFLGIVVEKLDKIKEWEGEAIHGTIHEIVKSDEEFGPKVCFPAIYNIFLGKEYGPQVGWFLSALDKEFVINRLKEGVGTQTKDKKPTKPLTDKPMEAGITYDQAKALLDEHIKDPIIKMHCRESEVVLRALARHFGEDEELWGIAGLIHDIDFDKTKNDVKNHCVLCVDILKNAGVTDELIEVIVSHAYGTECGDYAGKERTTKFQHALACGETVTGLIYAYGLMRPDKKLANAEVKSIKKKFKDKAFAAKVNREVIKECELIGLELNEFLEIALNAMKEIAGEIGL